jgi:hypothetical protein
MAQIDETLLGKLSGSFGDIIFHHGSGRAFLCRKPRSFVPGNYRYVTDLTNMISPQTGYTIIVGFITNCTSVSVSANATAAELSIQGSATGIDVNKEPNTRLAYVLCLTNSADVSLPRGWFVAGTSEASRAFETWRC